MKNKLTKTPILTLVRQLKKKKDLIIQVRQHK